MIASVPRIASLVALALLCAASGCVAERGDRTVFQHRTETEVSSPVYTVHPPDVIRLHAPMAPELDGVTQQVRADGKVSLRLIGEIEVAGLTPTEIAARVREKLAKFYIDPDVVVEVPGQNSSFYYVLGEVQWPGPRPVTGRDTLLHAIAEARPTSLAWTSRVQLIRSGMTRDERTVVNVDIDKLLERGDARDDVLLKVGDIIQVPPSPLAWLGLRVREAMFPVSPVSSAYTAPVGFINSPYTSQSVTDSPTAADYYYRRPYVRP
ncbi:MAG: polysaccharide export protein [Planctomycetes bacterium]|nr:polysaccharide export protein [Planctomycetota bacterium]